MENNRLENWQKFIKAGNAIFTIKNEETGNRFTFRVCKHTEKKLWFVKVLTGPENTTNYSYIGTIFEDGIYRITKKSAFKSDAPCNLAFNWLNDHLRLNKNLPQQISIYHMGSCGRCGRPLTVPESIKLGLGPECAGLI